MNNEAINNIPNYEGIGIYSLVDNFGNMYIGSSKNIRKRILQHEQAIKLQKENPRILKAIKDGKCFSCKVIEKFDYGVCQYDIRKRETYYIDKFKPFYNIASGSYQPPEFHLDGYEKATKKGNLELANYWLDIYKKLSTPILCPKNNCQTKHQKKNLKRIPLDVQKEKYEEIKAAADAVGEKVNQYIKKAIDERMERDSNTN